MVPWRLVGASQVVLALAHVVIWRAFGWTKELKAVSPLTARVFALHTFFITFVLAALGSLELFRPDLLVGELAHLLLVAAAIFWTLRLVAQPFLFDPVLLVGSPWRTPLRICATGLFATYAAIHVYACM
ncbi:MAG: hypothetical protein ABI321_22895 [Polyangia bacterium]